MKKYLVLIIIPLMIGIGGCENHKAELAQANAGKDSLAGVVNAKDTVINDFLASFNEIQDNLLAITQKENIVASDAAKNGEANANKPTKERIKDQIVMINDLMDKNKKAINNLTRKLKGATGKTVYLQKMVDDLNQQMEQKDKELADLNQKVEALNGTVATLNGNITDLMGQNQTKEQTIESQTKTIHTAYYTIGTAKQLKEEKVVDEEGGILGIGDVAVLKPNFNANAFKEVDITQTNTIPVNSKEAKLVTSHPADSYKFQMDKNKVTNIVITDPDKFWKASKYLVVVTD